MRNHPVIAIAIGASCLVLAAWLFLFYELWPLRGSNVGLTQTGTFGDSFGVLSSLFAGLALVGVVAAVALQHAQLQEARGDARRSRAEADESRREREAQAKLAARQEFERRFFELLERWQTMANETRVGDYRGQQAIRKLAERLAKKGQLPGGGHLAAQFRTVEGKNRDVHLKEIQNWYEHFFMSGWTAPDGKFVEGTIDQLGHYFRLLYHIVGYVDAAVVPDDAKLFCIQILRAHLSNPEQTLLFYNCLSEYGENFFPLIEKHKLLKNFNQGSLADPTDLNFYPSLINR